MKKLLCSLILVPALAFGQVVDRLTPFGCQLVASLAACVAQENTGKVAQGFCKESMELPFAESQKALPTADFTPVRELAEQEMNKVRTLKLKKDQDIFNEVLERCFAAQGEIKLLLNKPL